MQQQNQNNEFSIAPSKTMKTVLWVVAALAAVGLAFWLWKQNKKLDRDIEEIKNSNETLESLIELTKQFNARKKQVEDSLTGPAPTEPAAEESVLESTRREVSAPPTAPANTTLKLPRIKSMQPHDRYLLGQEMEDIYGFANFERTMPVLMPNLKLEFRPMPPANNLMVGWVWRDRKGENEVRVQFDPWGIFGRERHTAPGMAWVLTLNPLEDDRQLIVPIEEDFEPKKMGETLTKAAIEMLYPKTDNTADEKEAA